MTAVLVVLGLGDLAGIGHFIAHHRTGLTAVALAAAGTLGYRTRRRFTSTGQRKAGMPKLAPIRERKPEMFERKTT